MLFMGNKNMESYAKIVKTANKISELKFVAWVGLKPTFLVAKKNNPFPSCSILGQQFPFPRILPHKATT